VLLSRYGDEHASSLARQIFANSLSKMKHFEWYSTDLIYSDSTIVAARSHYVGYPFVAFQDRRELTIIDGAIYNKSEGKATKKLKEITAGSSVDQIKESIREFLQSTQGEFVVANYNKQSGRLLIFNDALGRLPFYYSSTGTANSNPIVASREMNFVIPFLKKTDFDSTALGEYLLFGYVLGGKTLLKDVKRLPPATMLMFDIGNEEPFSEEIFRWNLESKDEIIGNAHEEAMKLIKLFTSSLRDMAATFPESYTHIVSLSGGLDSRATLGGFVAAGLSPVACSFPSGEDRVAKEIAHKLNVRHHITSSPFEITIEDYFRIFGLLDIGLRSRVTYLFGLKEKMGDKAVLYTGDGGDKTLAPMNFRFSDPEELIHHVVKTDHIYELREIGSMLNIDIEEFRNHLRNHFSAYPERTMEGKLAHFKVFERGFNWLFIGEDRSRFFLWSTTPFYSIPFFKAAMNISQRFKAHYILYKDFLSNLNPLLSQVRYYNRLIPLSLPNWVLRIYTYVFDWLKEHLYRVGKLNPVDLISGSRSKSTYEKSDMLRKLALNHLKQKEAFNFLEIPKIRELVKDETNELKLSAIATLVTYMTFLSRLEREVQVDQTQR